ncbi:MAG: BON domain-containing protein [Nitrospira sp.]|nr:BON domain-containing protein [Nitrospira sp.]
MAMRFQWLVILSLLIFWPIGTSSQASEGHDKEGMPEKEKPATSSSPPPTVPAGKSEAATEHKEVVPDKPAVRQQPSPTSSDSQPTPHKSPAESKPIKAESLPDRKEGVSEKPATSSSPPPAAPAVKSEGATEHKEAVPEKPVVRQPPSPTSSDSQPAPHKSPAESKPTKAESLPDRKEGTLEKVPARPSSSSAATDGHGAAPKPSGEIKPQGQPAPTIKADLPPPAEIDIKEKETAAKKPMGSLILSVKLALMGDLRLFHYEIEVEDDKQVVTLSGRVSNEEDKTAATEVAQAVSGVKTVTNKLIVEKDLARTLLKKQDEILTLLIKERFAKSATLKSANFDIKTEEGIVQLNGTVRFQVIALEAAEAARQVPGVRAVNTEKIRLEGES